MKLHYSNLTRNRCPKCNDLLDFESDPTMIMCTISCGFMISAEKMQRFVMNMNARSFGPAEGALLR